MRFPLRLLLPVLLCGCATTRATPGPVTPLALGADLHVHLTMSHAGGPLIHGEPGDGTLASGSNQRLLNEVEAEHLTAAGVRVLYGAMWPPFRARPGVSTTELSLRQLRLLTDFTMRHPRFAVVDSVAEARRMLAVGRLAVFPQLEGGEALNGVDDVDAVYAGGARVITLVHFISSQLGGAARGQMERAMLRHPADGATNPEGLTSTGRAVVERMMTLGMVIDLAHASDAVSRDVLALSEAKGVPVIFSHSGARALLNLERNVSDELARRIVAGGGMVGVTLYDSQVETPAGAQLSPHVAGTCDDVVAHWKHFASVVPPESLAMGSDFNGFITRPDAGGRCADGIRTTGDLNALWPALEGAGVPRPALDGMGEQVLQMMEKVEAKADVTAQKAAKKRFAWVREPKSVLADVP